MPLAPTHHPARRAVEHRRADFVFDRRQLA